MSAYIVSKRHIDGMLASGLTAMSYDKLRWRHHEEWFELTLETADAVGSMLWAENVASVEHRYSPPGREPYYGEHAADMEPLEDLPGTYKLETIAPGVAPVEVPEWIGGYRYPIMRAATPSAVQALKLIDCYEYQSCEHDEWETSEAFAFCDALRRALIHNLPGYDEAKWGLS